MMPVTRARTSTSLEPCVCPTYSKLTGNVCGWTACTVTAAGGKPWKPPACCGDLPQAATSRTSARGKKRIGRRQAMDICDSLGEAAARVAAVRLVQSAEDTYNRSEEHTSELQSHVNLVCRLLLEKKKQ